MDVVFEPPGPGPWQQDSAHVPHGFSPLVAELYPEHAMRGFSETFARWGALLDTLAWGDVNGFPYHQPQPFDMPGPDGPPSPEFIGEEIGRRTGVAAAAFENKIWHDILDQWHNTLKPASIAAHRALGDVDLSELGDDELRAHVDLCVEHLQAMAYQHHRFNATALALVGDFVLRVGEWLGEPPMTLYGVFDGYSPVSGVLCPEIEPALEALRADADATALLRAGGDPATTLAELRGRLPEVDEFVRSVGFRLVEGFDVTSPTAIERPATIIGRLDAALDTDADAARRRANETAAAMRARVPAEHQDEFDELLTEARLTYPLRDERGLYSDISAFGLLRLALLEAAGRLVDRGGLQSAEHIFEARIDEIRSLMSGAGDLSAADLAERAARRQELVANGAPRYLGPPPPEPPPLDELPPPLARVMGAIGFSIEGVLGEMEAPAGDDAVVKGIGANPGVYEGPVHLVHSIDDLFTMEPGDVLVTASTGEAFNSMIHLVGAIVTDHGSYASHAGIVAREGGFPAVVGCIDATQRLSQGQQVRIDGGTGEIQILQ